MLRKPKTKICILAIGSRGDFQPYLALQLELQKAGHAVRMYGFENFAKQAKQYSVDFFALKSNVEEKISTDPGIREAMTEGDVKKFMEANKNILGPEETVKLYNPLIDNLKTYRPDLLITGGLSKGIGIMISSRMGIPGFFIDLQPMAPSSEYPSILADQMGIGGCCGVFNGLSHKLLMSAMNEGMNDPTHAVRAFFELSLGLPADVKLTWTDHVFIKPPWPLLICSSPTLSPQPKDWDANLQIIGPLVLPGDVTTKKKPPDAALVAFLKHGGAPVYIGWGSMICKSPEHMANLAIRALYETGERGIVFSGYADLSAASLDATAPDYDAVQAYAKKNIYFAKDLNHEWLFPQCKCTVHHGGSGTTHCALRAGRPTVVTPVFLDQFTYRRLITSLGCGVGSEQLNKLTSTKLAAAIREAGAAPMVARAKEVGERMRAEDGNAAAVAAIEKHLEEKVKTGAWKKDFDARVVLPATEGKAQETKMADGATPPPLRA